MLSTTIQADLAHCKIAATLARTTAEVFVEEHGITGNIAEFTHAFELAVSEAFTNSVRYAGKAQEPATVTITFEARPETLTARVIDTNAPFNPVPPTPEMTMYPDGGFGLFIINKMMDSVSYERQGDKNILSMTTGTKKP